jgi:hypothetical protein
MRLKNRFKNRFIYRSIKNSKVKYRVDFTARDFRASIICTLAKYERQRSKNISKNIFETLGEILNPFKVSA